MSYSGAMQIDLPDEAATQALGVAVAKALRAGDALPGIRPLAESLRVNRNTIAKDLDGAPVFLAKNAWDVGYVSDKNPAIRFTKTKERI